MKEQETPYDEIHDSLIELRNLYVLLMFDIAAGFYVFFYLLNWIIN